MMLILNSPQKIEWKQYQLESETPLNKILYKILSLWGGKKKSKYNRRHTIKEIIMVKKLTTLWINPSESKQTYNQNNQGSNKLKNHKIQLFREAIVSCE